MRRFLLQVALLAVLAAPLGALATTVGPGSARAQVDAVEAGRELFLTGCVSCHGPDGVGTDQGPTLIGVGAAAADFMLRTGRMPLAVPGQQPPRKEPAYNDADITYLVAYVASLGPGPDIPDVDPQRGDMAVGGELYRENCAACHQAAGSGGALSYGRHAPSLHQATATEIGEAPRIGPGQMPVFGPEVLSDSDLDSIALYVLQLDDPADPGGLSLGRIGPVAEGFVGILIGLGTLIVVARWVTRSRHQRLAEATEVDR